MHRTTPANMHAVVEAATTLLDEPWLRLALTPDGLFHVQISSQHGGTVNATLDLIQPHLEAHAPVRYLVDVSGVVDLPLDQRWRLARRMGANRQFILGSAVIGLSGAHMFMFNVIVRASGRSQVKAFGDEHEARTWLLDL